MNLRLKLAPGIYLVGFMGSGKSTVGRLLAERLGWPFIDIDNDIEAAAGMTISDIFAARGEAEFRVLETAAIRRRVRDVESGRPAVVGLGGGAFAGQANRDLLAGAGVTIWLDCPLETARERVARQVTARPGARDPEEFAELHDRRRQFYALADARVDAACGGAEAVVETILKLPELK